MENLFGTTLPPPITKPNSINPLIAVYGSYLQEPGQRCKDCGHFRRYRQSKSWFKCALRKNTRGAATDHRANYSACGRFVAIAPSCAGCGAKRLDECNCSPTLVTFVGIHYKEGKTALDASTLSGERIDKVISGLRNIEARKMNLFKTTYLPAHGLLDHLQDFQKRLPDKGIIVLLGKQVQEYFPYNWYPKAKLVRVKHPAYPKGADRTERYIQLLINLIQ